MKEILIKLRPFLIFLAPSFLIGAILGVYPGYRVYEFIWKDADFCTSCHVHDYATLAWHDSTHGALTTCHDCHHQSLTQYANTMIQLLLKNPESLKKMDHIPHIPKDLCAACHVSDAKSHSTVTGPLAQKGIENLPKVNLSHLHSLHLSRMTSLPQPNKSQDNHKSDNHIKGSRNIICTDCHGGIPNRAHNFTATDRSCLQCHENIHKTTILKTFGCRNCHFQEFMVPIEQRNTES